MHSRPIDEGHGVDIVFLDFAKAVDKVTRQRSLEKNTQTWLDGKLLSVVEN